MNQALQSACKSIKYPELGTFVVCVTKIGKKSHNETCTKKKVKHIIIGSIKSVAIIQSCVTLSQYRHTEH